MPWNERRRQARTAALEVELARWILTMGAIALYGCASPPPRQAVPLDVEIPGRWVAGNDVESTADEALPAAETRVESSPTALPVEEAWWTTFGAPGLDRAVGEALARNNDLRVALASVESAAAAARVERADLFPQVQAGGTGTRAKNNFPGFPFAATVYSTTWTTSLGSSWEFDLWGRLREGTSAALAEAQASEADLRAAQLSVAGQAVKSWLALTEAQLQLELAEETLDAYRRTAEVAWDRYSRGLLGSFDVHLTRTNTASASALVAQRNNQLQQARRRLEILLGRYPAARIEGAPELPVVPGPVPAGLPAEILGRRPDLVAAERRMAGGEARVSAARRARFPSLSLTASTGTATEELSDLLDGDFSVWNLAANLVQPIFQGGRIRARIDQSEARRDQATAQYVQAVLDAFQEVESALGADEHLQREVNQLEIAAQEAQAAWDLSEDRYDRGLGELLDVLESQRRALEARSNLLSTRRRRLENRVDLHLSLGGGFSRADDERLSAAAAAPPAPPASPRPRPMAGGPFPAPSSSAPSSSAHSNSAPSSSAHSSSAH